MSKLRDLTGQRFFRLLVIEREKNYYQLSRRMRTMWRCLCDCGNELSVESSNLISGRMKSCGCYNREQASKTHLKNLIGQKFGKLTVVSQVGRTKTKRAVWRCVCDCGKETDVVSSRLINKKTRSCGCISESYIVSDLKKYFTNNFGAKTEYQILKNPNTKYWLPYDIYIPKGKNIETNGIYIEVQGIQHYELQNWHKMKADINGITIKEEFKNQLRRDRLKKEFAKENGTYIEIDLRKIKTTEEAIQYIEERL